MQSEVVILGTGGTIAGTSASPQDNVGYTAAQLGVDALVEAVPGLAGQHLQAEQVAQIDSKDMSHAVWQRLAQRVAHHLERPDVAGIVITHGTDTLEETAYFLQRVLAPTKPVVLTAAMRPATALQADGPQNLLDALTVARQPLARGVVAVLAGAVHGAADVRKLHTYRLDAFGSGDSGPIAVVEEGRLRRFRPWPDGAPLGLSRIERDVTGWPTVEVIFSHAGVGTALARALLGADGQGGGSSDRPAGIVVAGTGNGTLPEALEALLVQAAESGVRVVRCSRCALSGVVGQAPHALPSAGSLSPWQARIELLLALLEVP